MHIYSNMNLQAYVQSTLSNFMFFFFLRCKIVMELVVQNERTGYYESTQVYLTVSVVNPAKLTLPVEK